MKKLLITGGSGLLGCNLAFACRDIFKTHITYLNNPVAVPGCESSVRLDLTNQEEVNKVFFEICPDIVIHTAALTDVDKCETEKELADASNLTATGCVAGASREIGARLIHISTDYVFDGRSSFYKEDAAPNPLSHYARTKLDSENIVSSVCDDFCIVRTTLYGWNVQNKLSFVEWILRKIENREQINLFTDQFYTPVLVNNLALALAELACLDYKGVLHCGGAQRCSRLELGMAVAEAFDMDKSFFVPVPMSALSFPAVRPHDSSLDISLAKSMLKTEFMDLISSLRLMRELKEQGYRDELKSSLLPVRTGF